MRGPHPPLFERWLAHVVVPVREREWVLGDLAELHAARAARDGVAAADRQYRQDVLSLLAVRVRGAAHAGPTSNFRRSSMVRDFVSDVRSALRMVRREPVFHVLAMVTLALGVGATAAVFAMANELVLRPLPGVTDSRSAAYLRFDPRDGQGPGQGTGLSLPDLQELRAGATMLEGIGSYGRMAAHVAVGSERPAQAVAGTVYGDFFEVLGVRASAGRLINAAETETAGESRIAVISERLQAKLFASSSNALGRTIHVNGEPVTIIGVVAGGFTGPERGDDYELWVPHPALVPLLDLPTDVLTSRNSVMHSSLVVRLRPSVTPAAAQAQIGAILSHLAEHPESREHLMDLVPTLFTGLHVNPMMRAQTFGSLRLLAGIVALVLLIACANAANLLLFRNVIRRGNLALRRALGASGGRIVREHLAESLVLAVFATAVGLGVAWLIIWQFRGENLMRMPAVTSFTLDVRVLAFAVGASLLTTLLFGALPATLAGRFDLGAAVREGGGRRSTRSLAGLRRFMSAAQIALSVTLLIGGLLLVRTLHKLYTADTGYDIESVAVLPLQIQNGPLTPAKQRELLAAVRAVPAVQSAAFDLYGPHSSRMLGRIARAGEAMADAERVTSSPITADWFQLLGVALIGGRGFTEEEAHASELRGVILTAALARQLFGTTQVVGRRVQTRSPAGPVEVPVLGVTEDLRSAHAPDVSDKAMFVPFGTLEFPAQTVLVRTREFNEGVAEQIRAAVETLLPLQPVAEPKLLVERLDHIYSERRLFSRMLTLLSVLGVTLAAIGLYAVVAFSVASRTREFGIRLALGAQTARIARLVLDDSARIMVAGAVFGLMGAYLLSKVLQSRLFGVERLDPASYVAAVVFFAFVALLATWSPTLAATRVDPMNTLKAQ